jgi:WD40 repeat protein
MEIVKICTRVLLLVTTIICLIANAGNAFATGSYSRIELAEFEKLLQFDNDGSIIITCTENTLNFYDVSTGKKIRSISPGSNQYCLAVSRDSKLLATKRVIINDPTAQYGDDTIFHFWNITGSNPQLLHTVKIKDGGTGKFSQDNRWFVNYGIDEFALIWDVTNGHLEKKIDKFQYRVESVSFSNDGKLFAAAGGNTVQLWQTDKWKRLRVLPDLSGSVSFSPDGKYLLGNINETTINLWDVNKNHWHWSRPAIGFYHDAIAFSPDSKLVAFAGKKTTYIYSVDTGKMLHELPKSASAIAFSPDGKHLALATYEESNGIKKNVLCLYASPDRSASFE